MALPTYLTLDQMLKSTPGNRPSTAQVISIFRESVFLNSRRFKDIGGAAESYEIEANLPTTEKRALNANFTDAGGGRTGLEHEALRIYGLKLHEDEAARKMGIATPSVQNAMAAKSTRLTLEYDSWYGDPNTDALSVGGFQYWAENSGDTTETSQSAGATSGGAALSVFKLREAIDSCIDPVALVMGQTMRNRLTGGAENTAAAGYVTYSEAFGQRLAFFDDLPIITMQRDTSNTKIGAFTEAAASGSSTASSIYILGSAYYWFQNGGPDMTDLPQADSQLPRRLMWLVGCVGPRYSVVRLKHIGNLAVVA